MGVVKIETWNLVSMQIHGDEDGLDEHGFCSDGHDKFDDSGSGGDVTKDGAQEIILSFKSSSMHVVDFFLYP